jgi:peptidyl-prolyl cis-trans isomerase SurA
MIGSQMFRNAGVAALLAGLVFVSANASATIVERVVAVVGEHPILLSELKRRATPFMKTMPGGAQSAQAQSRLYSDMLGRMIDEELVQRSASTAQLKVSDAEVESAIERVAKGNNVSVGQLLTEVERSGVPPTDYRRELRTQLLDAKVMNLRLQGRVRLTEDDVKAEYTKLVLDERRELPVRLAVIRLPLPSSGQGSAARALATRLSAEARDGADFGELSQKNSVDSETRDARGELAPVKPSQLPKEIGQLVLALSPGQVSAPVESGGQLVIVKVLERTSSSLPAYESVLPQLEQRVQLQKMEVARRAWLDSLRKTTHIEIRL